MPRTDDSTGLTLTGSGLLIGQEAHIRSSRPGGPRHVDDYGDFDNYENLILLCPTHHAMIDKNGGADWPADRLETMKASHEAWVRDRLSVGEAEILRSQILVAAEVQRVEDLLFQRAEAIYWTLNQAIPSLADDDFSRIVQVGRLLLAKDWPDGLPRLRESAERLRTIIALLGEHVHDAYEPETGVLRLVRSENRLDRWDPPLYERLFRTTQINMVRSWWIADALVRELNNWVKAVRADVDSTYRFAEGLLLAPIGDGIVVPVRHTRLEYRSDQRLPSLPSSLAHLTESIESAAGKSGSDPQHLDPAEVRLL
jgi:hypothetical protein